MDRKHSLARHWEKSGIITDRAVIRAFLSVPRELFVPPENRHSAYVDSPLPIPAGQSISQPTTVAIITQALELSPNFRVLEVGAGSGYQAAIIACIVGRSGKVFAVELVPELVSLACSNLAAAGISNVEVVLGDGSSGWREAAPFDRIAVSAACPEIPQELIRQLKDGGVLVAPVGPSHRQELIKLRKQGDGVVRQSLGDFVFVPLRHKH